MPFWESGRKKAELQRVQGLEERKKRAEERLQQELLEQRQWELQQQRELQREMQQQREKQQLEDRLLKMEDLLLQEQKDRAHEEWVRKEALRRKHERDEEQRIQKKRQEQRRREIEQQERDARAEKLRIVSPESLRALRELIRTRYELDVEIWSLRKVRKPDRPLVGEKMAKSDAILAEIRNILGAWDGTEASWSKYEWVQALEIKARIEEEGKRVWAGNPPWEED